MSPSPRRAAALAALALLTAAGVAPAQRARPWPAALPGLGAAVGDPGDGRAWSLTTRIDEARVAVLASLRDGSLAVMLQRIRRGRPGCAALIAQALGTSAPEPFRVPTPAALAGAPFEPEVYLRVRRGHEAEFGCLRVGDEAWLATAMARSAGGVSLADAAPMARRLARAVAQGGARAGYPLRLDVSGLELDDPGDGVAWLYTGPAAGFPVPSDTISAGAGDAGGVTLTVARRPGTCAAAWDALRRVLADDGALVDRPGYVPAAFGSRVRRIASGARLREVYCLGTARGATLVTAVFGATDGDAMSRLAPMLRAVVTASARAALAP